MKCLCFVIHHDNRILALMYNKVPDQPSSHQRPLGYLGEWELTTAPTAWQKLARVSGGWVTPANLISLGSSALFCKGLIDFSQGNYLPAAAAIGVSRVGDILDGVVAAKTKTRGEIGALLDSAGDKLMAIGGITAASLYIDHPLGYGFAGLTALQQGRIALENIEIKRLGGDPTPNKAGKLSMFALSLAYLSPIAGAALQQAGHTTAETGSYALGVTAAIGSLVLSRRALHDYQVESQALHLTTPIDEAN